MELTEDQIKYKVAILLTLFTIVRLEEFMGLEWYYVDFRNGIIYINRSCQYLAEKGVFTKTPKTENSIREVGISDFVVLLLEKLNYGMTIKKSSVTNYGLILIGYLCKQMVSQCILLLLVSAYS